jgi:hypothetical protein
MGGMSQAPSGLSGPGRGVGVPSMLTMMPTIGRGMTPITQNIPRMPINAPNIPMGGMMPTNMPMGGMIRPPMINPMMIRPTGTGN